MKYLCLLFSLFLISCDAPEDEKPSLVLKPVAFSDLPGWRQHHDNFEGFYEAFEKSCDRIKTLPADRAMGPLPEAGTVGDWQRICEAKGQYKYRHEFWRTEFQPYQVFAGDNPDGLFTGYYEASLKGSRTKQGPYRYPLHARPDDLIMVQLGDFRDHLKGERIAGRVVNGSLKPYETRQNIIEGQWPHNDKVLLWVDDPVDAFFVQIQGSGLVQLDDGSQMRIGYAGQNGHPYYAIGRELIDRGALTKAEVSLQSIRAWLSENPDKADEVMNTNRSYVFFRELNTEGPVGGQGVALTAGRSLAIDRSLISYGIPVWVDLETHTFCDDLENIGGEKKEAGNLTNDNPIAKNFSAEHSSSELHYIKLNEGEEAQLQHGLNVEKICGKDRLKRMMITQDTGGAIRGPVRGDFFWGYGPAAEYMAGKMKASGQYWLLLPKI